MERNRRIRPRIAGAVVMALFALHGGASAAEAAAAEPTIEEMLSAVGEMPARDPRVPPVPGAGAWRPADASGPAAEPDPTLARFDSLLEKGDYAAAKALVHEASKEPPEGAGEVLLAAARVADMFLGRRTAMRRALEPSIGVPVTVWTAAGRRKGDLESVSDDGMVLAAKTIINREVRRVTRFTVPWRDLTAKEQDRLSERWEAGGPDGDVARAALAIFREDIAAAESCLLMAGGHPLAAHYRSRAEDLKAAAADSAARLAWEKVEKKAGAETLTPDAARDVLADIDAFEKEHGRTRFAAAWGERVRATRARAEAAMAPLLGLVGHWRFDEGKGRSAADSSGKKNHATLEGAGWAPGRFGGGVLLDGTGQVAVADGGALGLGGADFTVAAWIGTESDGPVLCRAPAEGRWGEGGKILFVAGGRLFFNTTIDGGFLSAGPLVNDGQWHHVAAAFSTAGNVLRLYVDGIPESSAAMHMPRDGEGFILRIGSAPRRAPAEGSWNGVLDDVRVYSRALSDAEIAALGAGPAREAAEKAHLSAKEVTAVYKPEGGMKPWPVGYRPQHFPSQEGEDPTGCFRGKAVYFDQRTGQDVLYEVRTARPVRKATVRMAAMQNLVIEVLDAGGKTVGTTGPHGGGNHWAVFEVTFPPQSRFVMRFHNEVSHWLLIDRVFLE